ncbi:hypothetical protein [Reinekea sp.]|uniref:hypothetical protein n=1 Tax=Reinekea sp. TaxID=1970455 RepID=UPI003989E131
MKKLKIIVLTGLVLFGSFSFSETNVDNKFQVNLVSRTYSGNYNVFGSNPGSLLYELKGIGLEGRYIYSPWTTIGVQIYQMNQCSMASNSFNIGCEVDKPLVGLKIELLTGYNMNGQGVYVYTGTHYFWEGNKAVSFGSFTIPLGIGANFKQFNVELFAELREGNYVDLGDSGYFSGVDPSYTSGAGGSVIADTMPVGISIGYRF